VRAIEVYDRVIKIVSPKKEKLAEAEAALAFQMATLNDKRMQLQQVKCLFDAHTKIDSKMYC
jgi:dynein heavy chain, axonemal